MLKLIYKLVPFVFVILFFLSACSSNSRVAQPDEAVATTSNAATSATLSDVLRCHAVLIDNLKSNLVQVVQVGDTVKLILPSNQFFIQGTPILNKNYYSVLNQVATLLQGLDKYSVKVAGYTDDIDWSMRNLALSRQQAGAIAKFLWKQGIDTRLLSSVGYGEQMPIASNKTVDGQAMNRRVEITVQVNVEPDDM